MAAYSQGMDVQCSAQASVRRQAEASAALGKGRESAAKASPVRQAPPAKGFWRNSIARLASWRRRYRQRRALLALDAGQLKDIGISRVDALQEGCKPFWRP